MRFHTLSIWFAHVRYHVSSCFGLQKALSSLFELFFVMATFFSVRDARCFMIFLHHLMSLNIFNVRNCSLKFVGQCFSHEGYDMFHALNGGGSWEEMRSVHYPPVSLASVQSMCHCELTRQDTTHLPGKWKKTEPLSISSVSFTPVSSVGSSLSSSTFNSGVFPTSSFAGR